SDDYNSNKDFYMKLNKKCYEGNNEIKNFTKAKEEYEKKQKELQQENEIKVLKLQKFENVSLGSSNTVIITVPDCGIDIQGNFKNISFIMQLKYTINPEDYPVKPDKVREFRGVYFDRVNALYGMNYNGTNFVGIFLTNGRYTEAAFAEVKNYENKIFLCVEKQVVTIKDSNRYSPYKRINNDTNNDIID
ncbi:13442_t:CDS:2, partial [Cetraspora pellucida]